MTRGSRVSRARIIAHLRLASRQGDRAALQLGLDQIRTLAYSPRYWVRYLELLSHPLARLVDLLVIKQGDRIARQKGWPKPRRPARSPKRGAGTSGKSPRNLRPPSAPGGRGGARRYSPRSSRTSRSAGRSPR
jgi:hypothetical protein